MYYKRIPIHAKTKVIMTSRSPKDIPVATRFSKDFHDKLVACAERSGSSVSELIRSSIYERVEQLELEEMAKEAARRAAEARAERW